MGNIYLEKVSADFLAEVEKKKRLEEDLNEENKQEYANTVRNVSNLVMELLKMGIEFTTKDELLSLIVNGKNFEFSLPAIRELVDIELYKVFFPEPKPLANPIPGGGMEIAEMITLTNSIQKEKLELQERYNALLAEHTRMKDEYNNALSKSSSCNTEQLETVAAALKEKEGEAIKYKEALKENETRLNVVTEQLNVAKGDIHKLNEQIIAYEAQLQDYERKAAERDVDADIIRENETLKRDNAMLEQLAYWDAKTGVHNANAFNRAIAQVDKSRAVFAMISICGMRRINERFGRVNGDAAISCVAEKLAGVFGKENVYRVLGDRFNIISVSHSFTETYNRIAEIKSALSVENVNINIAFGIADGVCCESVQRMVQTAEEEMQKMKRSKKEKDITEWEKKETPTHIEAPVNAEMLDSAKLLDEYLKS